VNAKELRNWCARQKANYRCGTLSKEKIRLLESIPGWSWNRQLKFSAEWVPHAEELAKERGGVLPNTGWLQENGYKTLARAIYKNPGLFSHIPQKNLKLSPEDRVPEAEKLAKEHNGVLPNSFWLRQNGYGPLHQAMRGHPTLFSHIPQKKMWLSAEEWVPKARELAEQSKNKELPTPKWLAENGYSGLLAAIRANRDLFSHIPQAREEGPQKHVSTAETLAAAHGGFLPRDKWLREHAHRGLADSVRKHPHLFAHIPKSKGKGSRSYHCPDPQRGDRLWKCNSLR